MTGDKVKDLKDVNVKPCNEDPMPNKSAFISDLQDINNKTNYLLNNLNESISHLEEFI